MMKVNEQMKTEKNEKEVIELEQMHVDNRTTITFPSVSYRDHNGKKVAIISMK